MSNWLETNQTKSVIIYTLIIAAAVWAFFLFVFDENKVNLYKAQVNNVKAEAKEVSARNEVLATRLDYLGEDNKKLRSWLEETPKTIPYYEKEITKLNTEIAALKSSTPVTTVIEPTDTVNALYKNTTRQSKATSFVDNKTNIVFGVEKLNYGNTANINLTLPDGKKIKTKDATPGETWRFTKDNSEYMVILDSVDWATGRYVSSVIELPKEKKNK